MKLHDGCGVESKKKAKLETVIYGIKQSGRKWGRLSVDTLMTEGFDQCKVDPCTFRQIADEGFVMIL